MHKVKITRLFVHKNFEMVYWFCGRVLCCFVHVWLCAMSTLFMLRAVPHFKYFPRGPWVTSF